MPIAGQQLLPRYFISGNVNFLTMLLQIIRSFAKKARE